MLVKPKLKYNKELKADCYSVCPTCTKPNIGGSFVHRYGLFSLNISSTSASLMLLIAFFNFSLQYFLENRWYKFLNYLSLLSCVNNYQSQTVRLKCRQKCQTTHSFQFLKSLRLSRYKKVLREELRTLLLSLRKSVCKTCPPAHFQKLNLIFQVVLKSRQNHLHCQSKKQQILEYLYSSLAHFGCINSQGYVFVCLS